MYRLVKVAKELNVSTSTLVEVLCAAGYDVENKPITRLTPAAYAFLKNYFNPNKR